MNDASAYMLQRVSAAALAPMVLIHLALILYAIEGGLSSQEILARTRATILWPMFYTMFVLTISIHAPLGLRNIISEWTSLSEKTTNIISLIIALLLLITGLRAVVAIM